MFDNECMYCAKDEKLTNIMIPICQIDDYPLYLNKNQTYKGRVILAYDDHIGKIAEMDTDKCSSFFIAVQKVTKILTKIFNPGQINIGMYADKMCHLHCHVTPKYDGEPDWGGIFQMNPQPSVQLSEEEYARMVEDIRKAAKELACDVH